MRIFFGGAGTVGGGGVEGGTRGTGEALISKLGEVSAETTASGTGTLVGEALKVGDRRIAGGRGGAGYSARLQGMERVNDEPLPLSDCMETVPCMSFASFLHISQYQRSRMLILSNSFPMGNVLSGIIDTANPRPVPPYSYKFINYFRFTFGFFHILFLLFFCFFV